VRFGLVAKHRGAWPVDPCEALPCLARWFLRVADATTAVDAASRMNALAAMSGRASRAATAAMERGGSGTTCLPLASAAARTTWNG
jgi:hypothetical protein